tara:strand:+ start:46 stop:1050 length:1005 start_codon:yes stop_codon:yes gene_type:complete
MNEIGAIIVIGLVILVAIFYLDKKQNTNILEALSKKDEDSDLEDKITVVNTNIDNMMSSINSITTSLGGVTQSTQDNLQYYNNMIKKITDIERVFTTSQTRGNIGEKTVENIIEWIGLKQGEGKAWAKQVTEGASRPDFTFYFPNDAYVHLDAKFPLIHYKEMIKQEPKSLEEKNEKKAFKGDVRNIIKKIHDARKDYIEHKGGINFVMLFIPNMQILNFIREEFDDLYESSLRKKILLIGPSELYAILEFLKTAVETVRIQESSKEITKLVQDFKREWSSEMLETLETLRRQLDIAHSTLNSDILGTRKRKLESYIDKINNVSPSRDSEDTEE